MPIYVFGSTSGNKGNKSDLSLFVQKPYLRTNYREGNKEEYVHLKNQSKIKILPDAVSIGDPASKLFVNIRFSDPSTKKNSAYVDFDDKNLNIVPFVKVNNLPAVRELLTSKFFVDEANSHSVDESSIKKD